MATTSRTDGRTLIWKGRSQRCMRNNTDSYSTHNSLFLSFKNRGDKVISTVPKDQCSLLRRSNWIVRHEAASELTEIELYFFFSRKKNRRRNISVRPTRSSTPFLFDLTNSFKAGSLRRKVKKLDFESGCERGGQRCKITRRLMDGKKTFLFFGEL